MTYQDLNQRPDSGDGESSYEAPRVEALGTIEELTLGQVVPDSVDMGNYTSQTPTT